MNFEFKDCVEKGKIKEYSRGCEIAGKELWEAKTDYKSAAESMAVLNYKWATVQAYYAMFHTARALLYNKNYRETSHYCLILAVKELYVNQGLLDAAMTEALQEGKNLMEAADYNGEWSEDTCKKLLKKAGLFIEKADKLIN